MYTYRYMYLCPPPLANIQSVQEGDHILPFLIKSKPGTHWEMRRKTDTKTVKVRKQTLIIMIIIIVFTCRLILMWWV